MAGRVGKFGAMLGTVMVALKLKERYDECEWLMTPMLLLSVGIQRIHDGCGDPRVRF